ncbi:hypothetical protein TNCV_2567791 [Trichonephila clavipes]|uniref:Uncharacterized protein n=1 Tax=Trichonephila clavipes TaxID=2585209 RepID=A0A8X6WKH4_TRICX|nr:hypothetical protein TNCV_2567791 [Trichonephila clavipes]
MDFFTTDFVSKCLIATPSLHVPTTHQVVPSPPRTATPSGTINNYDIELRLALRAICPATDSDSSLNCMTTSNASDFKDLRHTKTSFGTSVT